MSLDSDVVLPRFGSARLRLGFRWLAKKWLKSRAEPIVRGWLTNGSAQLAAQPWLTLKFLYMEEVGH